MPQLNRKQFPVSVAIAGAIVTPIWTGSLKYADRHSWSYHLESDAQRYEQARGLKPEACLLAALKHQYDDDNERKICEDAERFRGQNVTSVETFNPAAFVPS